ncbi:MAG: DNA polymerase III subunit delta [Myxococcales bacterium]|nr:DNA polymerase III subunit delta [Myxococcales bacterium]
MNWASTLMKGTAPVYLIHGEERFLARGATTWLRQIVLAEGVADFNLDRFDAKESVNAEGIVQACRTLPMMAPKRLVWVRHAETVFTRKKDALTALINYVKEPDPTTCLVFEATTLIKKTSALFKAVNASGCVFECRAPRQRELNRWVVEQVRLAERDISSQAAEYLAESVGGNLSALSTALERLMLFVNKPDRIELSHAQDCVPHTRTHTVWELIDAIADRNVSKTLARAHQLLGQGKVPLQLLALVVRQFRQLLIGHDVRRHGGSLSQAASAAGIPSFRHQQFGRQLDRYTYQELFAALRRLEHTDQALKRSKLPDELLFEGMLLDLCAPTQ